MIPPDFLGTLPGWITAASTTTGLVTLIVAYWRRGVSLRGLAVRDNADIRDHYDVELKRITEAQHECEKREADLRRRVTVLENDILGLIRIITQASADKVIRLDDRVSEEIRSMAARITTQHKFPRR